MRVGCVKQYLRESDKCMRVGVRLCENMFVECESARARGCM